MSKKGASSEVLAAHGAPAVLTDWFYVEVGPNGGRLAFAEACDGKPIYHSAISASIDNLQALRALLNTHLPAEAVN